MGTKLKFTGAKPSIAGYYQCVVSNCAGRAISQCASLTFGKGCTVVMNIYMPSTQALKQLDFFVCVCALAEPPRVATHPESQKVCLDKPAVFNIQATGAKPLNYHWQWKPAEEEGEWQPCRAEWCNGATLTIPSVQIPYEGSCCCVVDNCAGKVTSNLAKLSIGKNLSPD